MSYSTYAEIGMLKEAVAAMPASTLVGLIPRLLEEKFQEHPEVLDNIGNKLCRAGHELARSASN